MILASFWDRSYRDGSHREHWEAPAVPPELVELVAGSEPRSGSDPLSALDLGCGTGLEAVYLARHGYRVLGVDTSHVALELARGRAAESGVEAQWCVASVLVLPVAGGSFDLVTDRGCYHLFGPEDRPGYAAEVTRVLRPGGRFLLRGAREDEEEAGLFGLDRAELETLFPSPRFLREPWVPMELAAPAGDLPAYRVLLHHRR
jgi:SAM-dependent methyltransferase